MIQTIRPFWHFTFRIDLVRPKTYFCRKKVTVFCILLVSDAELPALQQSVYTQGFISSKLAAVFAFLFM